MTGKPERNLSDEIAGLLKRHTPEAISAETRRQSRSTNAGSPGAPSISALRDATIFWIVWAYKIEPDISISRLCEIVSQDVALKYVYGNIEGSPKWRWIEKAGAFRSGYYRYQRLWLDNPDEAMDIGWRTLAALNRWIDSAVKIEWGTTMNHSTTTLHVEVKNPNRLTTKLSTLRQWTREQG